MKSRETIEANFEEHDSRINSSEQENSRNEPYPGATEKIAPWRFQPGKSGNPGGRPKQDMAAEIARAVFEENPELVYSAMARVLRKGSAFGFQVLSDRAYGKLGDKLDVNLQVSLAERLEKARKRKSQR